MGRQKHVTGPLCIFRGPWLLYSQARNLWRAVSSLCSPPDFGTTQIKKEGRLPCAVRIWVRLYTVQCGHHPSPPSPPPARALTWVLSASLACNARFQIFLAELASRSSSRQHRVQLTFLQPLPILQLVKGISSQMVRGDGPSGRGRGGGRSWKCGAEVCTVCRTVSAPLGRVPGIMCPRPAQAPPPRPALPMGAAHRVIFSLPYCIWPGDSTPDRRLQPRQLRSQWRRQQAGVSRC